jgi:protein translocase SecG subunit
MKQYLLISQILVAIFLILTILLQRGGSAFGGVGLYLTRRGLEKKIFWLTCILGTLFVVLALLNLVI